MQTEAIQVPPADVAQATPAWASTRQLLRYAAKVWQVPLPEDELDRQLCALPEGDHDDRAAHEAALIAGARVVGFQVVRFQGQQGDLLQKVHAKAPAFCLVAGEGERPRWVVLLGERAGKVLLGEVWGAEPRELAQDEVKPLLHAGSSWFFLEPSKPLEAARSEEHDHHDHHHMPPAQRLMALLRPEAPDLWVVFAYAVVVGLLSLAVPIAVQALVNTVAFGVLRQPVVVLTALVLMGLLFAGALRAAQVHVVEVLQRRIFIRAAMDVAGRLSRVASGAFEGGRGPELVNRFFDVLTLQKSAATLLLDGVGIVLQVAIGAVILGFYHPLLLAFDVLLVVALLFVVVVLGRGGVSSSIEESKAKYAVVAWLQELARSSSLFHGPGGQALAVQQAQRLCGEYLEARREHFGVVLRQTLAVLALHAVASAVLLGVGALLVLQRQLTLGQLVAAELIVSAMLAGVSKLGKYLEVTYDLLTAADKLGHLIDIPQERAGGEEMKGAGPVGLEVQNLSFAHDDEGPRREVLAGLSVQVEAGRSLVVVSQESGGLSTLADLLLGHRDPSGGSILFDGVELRELSLDSLRDQVALVRDAELLDGTVMENVRAGCSRIGVDEVRSALAAVGLLDAVRALPGGIHHRLSPEGAPLSSSQAALLSLARALAKSPRLLVIDGLLDELSPERREAVLGKLLEPHTPWTLVLLTRKPELAPRCGRALQLSNGALIELNAAEKGAVTQ